MQIRELGLRAFMTSTSAVAGVKRHFSTGFMNTYPSAASPIVTNVQAALG